MAPLPPACRNGSLGAAKRPAAVVIFTKIIFQTAYFALAAKKIAKTFGQFKNNA